jgi:hypothetical protein
LQQMGLDPNRLSYFYTITRFNEGMTPRSVLRVFAITPRVSSSNARLA